MHPQGIKLKVNHFCAFRVFRAGRFLRSGKSRKVGKSKSCFCSLRFPLHPRLSLADRLGFAPQRTLCGQADPAEFVS
jgi:hypothetical protein